MPKILQNHFVLAVHDLEQSSRFFLDLGFEVVNRPDGWIFVKRDNCMIMLGECPDALRASELGDHSYFGYLLVDEIDEYYQEVRARGVEIMSPIANKPWGLREFGVRSPEGHRMTIGQVIGGNE